MRKKNSIGQPTGTTRGSKATLQAADTVAKESYHENSNETAPAAHRLMSVSYFSVQPASELHEGQVSLSHGYIPHTAMKEALPPAYTVWDQFSQELPNYIKKGSERLEIQALPVLHAQNNIELPDAYLSRAAAILGNAAHAYYYNQRHGSDQISDPLPDSIRVPWEEVNQRIGRALPEYEPGKLKASRSHYDTFLCNWRLNDAVILDGESNVDVQLDDLELQHVVFSTRDESVFNRTILLMEMRFAPAIRYMLNALTATVAQKDEQLIEALRNITYIVEKVTEALIYIDPNQYSKYHVDQSVWARTVAKFDGSIPGGLPGLGAGLLPLFHTLDCFIERYDYNTTLGEDMLKKRQMQPRPVAFFLNALRMDLAKHSLRNYVQQSNNQTLKNQYQSFMDAYVGREGLLDAHALKAYGYLKLTFRAGRLETTGGNTASAIAQSETQRPLHKAFLAAEKERLERHTSYPQFAPRVETTHISSNTAVIKLDAREAGLDFEPGDRCAILPQNSAREITLFLKDFHLDAQQTIVLNEEWHQYLAKEWNIHISSLLWGELLKYADLTFTRKFHPAGAEMTIETISPLTARLFSVSPLTNSEHISLTVGKRTYTENDVEHEGVASSYLLNDTNPVRIKKLPAKFFRLPQNNQTPILMFAAGTGISPFVGFLESRRNVAFSGKNWLFYSVANHDSFFHADAIAAAIQENRLDLSVIFSREHLNRARFDRSTQSFQYYQENGSHIDAMIREQAKEIADLILNENAHIYVCGGAGFANSIDSALSQALKLAIPNDNERSIYMRSMVADHRYNNDIFTPPNMVTVNHSVHSQKPLYRSEIATHNKPNDSWMILNGVVYDFSHYMHIHPGGQKIIKVNAGVDGSDDYNQIGHAIAPQIEAVVRQYALGNVLKPVFLQQKNTTLYHNALRFLESIVEMENTLANNTEFFDNNHAPALWRDVYGVFVQANLVPYVKQETSPTTSRYDIGFLLSDLCDQLSLSDDNLIKNYNQLANSAKICAVSIREIALNQLSDSHREYLRNVAQSVTQQTFAFVEGIKIKLIAMMQEMETLGDNYELEVLREHIRSLENHISNYSYIVNHIHTATKAWYTRIRPEAPSLMDNQQASAFAFTHSVGSGVCPYGFKSKAIPPQTRASIIEYPKHPNAYSNSTFSFFKKSPRILLPAAMIGVIASFSDYPPISAAIIILLAAYSSYAIEQLRAERRQEPDENHLRLA